MKELADVHKIKHHFTVAYSTWVNGGVEKCMQRILAAKRCELKLAPQEWQTVTGMIQTSLNKATLPRLGLRDDDTFRKPFEVMKASNGPKSCSGRLISSTVLSENMEKARSMKELDMEVM